MSNDPIARVRGAIEAFAKGAMVVVTDDDDRENEGDLIVAASLCTPEKMAFIIRHTCGIVCAPLSQDEAKRLRLDPMGASNDAPLGTAFTVSVDVRNTGKVAGDEVGQLYLRDVVSSVTRPRKELKGFKRVTLAPGAATTLSFTLDSEAFALWDKDMKRVVEPGEFQIMSGSNSAQLKSTTLTVKH